jgi:hypothetical protein
MAQRSGDAGIAAFAQSIELTLVHHKQHACALGDVAALAQVLGQPPVPSAVQGPARAVPAGSGV